MENVFIPQGYQRLMPYIIVKGADDFIEFLKKVFGATEKMMHRRETGEIMHAEVFIGDSVIMIGNASDQWQPMTAGLYIHVADADASYQLALKHGATSVTEVTDQNYGRSGGVEDPFGNTWWITTTNGK
jgi:PhnB protein